MGDAVRSGDGVAIGTMTEGEGPPLLLVHGGMRTAANWAPLWPLLTARYRVTAMDRRGRGMSGDGQEHDGEREYDDVAAVARHRLARNVTVPGHFLLGERSPAWAG